MEMLAVAKDDTKSFKSEANEIAPQLSPLGRVTGCGPIYGESKITAR